MIIEKFLVYFLLFIAIFSYPGLKNKEKPTSIFKFFSIPVFLGIVMVLLTAIKIYFVYKFLLLLVITVMFLLSYWQWGKRFRRFWK